MTELADRTADLLERRLARAQVEGRLPSGVAGVVRDGSLVWSAGAGLLDGAVPGADTQYRIGSITKTFVAVAVLRLRDEGDLDLGDRLEDHLPGTPFGEVTIAQLLAHQAGLQSEAHGPWWERTPGASWEAVAAQLDPAAVVHPPGRRFHYSNLGYAVLGELVAQLRGAPWDGVVRDELLGPLGMARTTTRPVAPAAPGLAVHPHAEVVLAEPEHDAGALAPAGQLWSTIADLARWAALLAGHGPPEVLHPDTLAEMRRPVALWDEPGRPWTNAHGLGLQVFNLDGRRAVGHGGSMPGFLALVRVDVETGDGLVLATNTTAGLDPELTGDLLAILDAEEPHVAPAWTPTPVDAATLALTGTWYWGPSPQRLRALPDGWVELAPATGPGRRSRFEPRGVDTWVGLEGYYAGEPLRAVRRDDGEVTHLDLASFVLTRRPYDPDTAIPGGVSPDGWR